MIPDLYVWSGATGSGTGLNWNDAYPSLAALEEWNESNPFLRAAQRIYVASDHVESNVDSPSTDDYWHMRLRNNTPMPCQIISVDRATMTPQAMLANCQFDHVLALRADAIWCGVNFKVSGDTPHQNLRTMRVGRGRFFDCNLVSKRHFLLGSYYGDDRHVHMHNCLIESQEENSVYTFLTTSTQDREGSTLFLDNCELRHANTRNDGNSAWWHLDADYAHVRLLDCTFSGLGNQNKIVARGNHSVFEANWLPAGFIFEDLTGTNKFVLRS